MSMLINALRELVRKECDIACKRINEENKKYVIFPAGPTAQRFSLALNQHCGIDAEFFVDNNPEVFNKSVCGKMIKSFDYLKESCEEYNILIPTSIEYYLQISTQLENSSIPTYCFAAPFIIDKLWHRYDRVSCLLDDEYSKISYWGALYSMLTNDNRFISNNLSPNYFGITEFTIAESTDIIVDAGAFVGYTVEEFVKRSYASAKIYAFEPSEKPRSKLLQRKQRLENEWCMSENLIEVVPAGVGLRTENTFFSGAELSMLKSDDIGEFEIQIFSLDDYFCDKKPFTILKADIEGVEMDMLKGAAGIIKRTKPKMALSIYHSPQDFVLIPEYVHSLVPEYKLYLRTHTNHFDDTILYCVV